MKQLFVTAMAGLAMLAANGIAQTKVNLKNQSKEVDFSNSTYTKPIKMGGTLPSGCQLGELFYLTTASQGNNVYGCTSSNTWVLEGGLTAGPAGSWLFSNGNQTAWIGVNGDLTGTPNNLQVSGLRGRPVSATAPASGQFLIWDGLQWKPQVINGSPGTVTIKSGSTTVGTQGVVSFIAGTGIVNAITSQAGELRIQQNVDSAVVMLRTDFQKGDATLCASTSAANVYSCALAPVPAAYETGMRLFLRPDAANTAAVTLNLNSLGAVGVKRADGATDLIAGDLAAGQLYPLWYDGTNFRMVETPAVPRTSEYCTAIGLSNAYSCALTPALAAYGAGVQVMIRPAASNTGAVTLNVNGLGATSVKRADGTTDLIAGDLAAGQLYPLWHDGTNFRMVETPAVPRTSEYCTATAASNAYSCALTPALAAYGAGVQVMLQPGASNTGAVTLNVNGLGATGVKRADGTTDLLSGDLVSGQLYPLWHDGTNFRLVEPLNPVRASSAARPACDVTRRGMIYEQFGATGVKDSVAVCAKDASDAYAWRTIY